MKKDFIINKFNFTLFGAGDVVHTTSTYTNSNTGATTDYQEGAGLSAEMRTYYSDYLIDLAEPKLVHSQFGQKHPIPKNGGKTIQFRKYDNLPKLTTPLKEGVTPTGQKMNATVVEATVNQFGGFIELSDMLLLTAIDNNLVQATKLLASQAGRSIDTVIREVLNSGTNVQYADGSVSAPYLISGGSDVEEENNYLTVDYIKRAVRALKNQNAETINGEYVVIIHPDASFDLTNDKDWKFPHQYVDTKEIYSGEIGSIAGCRFVESTEAKVWHAEDLSKASRNLTATSSSGTTINISESLTSEDQTNIKGRKILVNSEQLTVVSATASALTVDKAPSSPISASTTVYPGEAGAKGRDLYQNRNGVIQMRLPYAKYGDKFTKQSQVRFNGYNHSLYARDGDIFDMQNMSSDQFPLLTPRNERKVYQTATSWTIFDSSDFEFGPEKRFLYISLTDGVAGSIMKELDKVTLKFEDGSAFADNAGTYIVKSISATADTRYKIDFYNTEFSAVGKPDDDKKLTITVVGSVINTEVLVENISLGNSTTEITEKNAEYEFSDDTFKIINYSDFINTKIQTLTIQTTTQKLLGYGDDSYQSSVTWRIKSSENNIVHLRSSNRNGSSAIMNAFNSDLVSIKFYNGNTSYTMEVSGDIRKVDAYEVELHSLFGTTIPPVGDDAFDIEVYNAILGPKNSQTESSEVEYSENNSSSSRYVLFYGPDGWEFQTTTTTYSDFTYKHECSKATTTYSYGNSASILVDSIGSGDCLYWVTPEGYFFYDNILRGKLTKGEKTFTETGAFIWIMPDMAYYNKATGKIVENTAYTQSQRLYSTGSYKLHVDSSYIEIDKSLPDWEDMSQKYKVDDTIKITIRDTDYKKYEYSVSITKIETVGDYGRISYAQGTVQTIYPYKILRLSIALDIPDLRFVCAANNRIWGCNEDTIFCSVFGDPFRWFNYSASDSGNVGDIAWSITPFITGSFTGCVSYRDTPLFFMEDKIIAVNGTRASNFELSIDNAPGVLSGAEKSIVISNDNIYYLSRDGIIRYYSYTPINISEEFYERFSGGCGGATNSKVYMSLWNDNGEKLFVYDINKKIWSVEDDFKSKSFTYFKGDLLGVSKDNVLYIMNSQEDEKEGIESFVEFGDYYCSSPDKKVISKLFIRLSIDEGASVLVSLNYDSQKDDSGKRVWHSTKVLKSTSKKSFVLPIVPKRCDHFRIKISGQGGYVIYGLTHEYYNGTFI